MLGHVGSKASVCRDGGKADTCLECVRAHVRLHGSFPKLMGLGRSLRRRMYKLEVAGAFTVKQEEELCQLGRPRGWRGGWRLVREVRAYCKAHGEYPSWGAANRNLLRRIRRLPVHGAC